MDHSLDHYLHTRTFRYASTSESTLAATKSLVVDCTDWYTGHYGLSLSGYWLYNRSSLGCKRSGVALQCSYRPASVDFLAREVAMEPVARHRYHLFGCFSRQIINKEILHSHFFTCPGGHDTPEVERNGT